MQCACHLPILLGLDSKEHVVINLSGAISVVSCTVLESSLTRFGHDYRAIIMERKMAEDAELMHVERERQAPVTIKKREEETPIPLNLVDVNSLLESDVILSRPKTTPKTPKLDKEEQTIIVQPAPEPKRKKICTTCTVLAYANRATMAAPYLTEYLLSGTVSGWANIDASMKQTIENEFEFFRVPIFEAKKELLKQSMINLTAKEKALLEWFSDAFLPAIELRISAGNEVLRFFVQREIRTYTLGLPDDAEKPFQPVLECTFVRNMAKWAEKSKDDMGVWCDEVTLPVANILERMMKRLLLKLPSNWILEPDSPTANGDADDDKEVDSLRLTAADKATLSSIGTHSDEDISNLNNTDGEDEDGNGYESEENAPPRLKAAKPGIVNSISNTLTRGLDKVASLGSHSKRIVTYLPLKIKDSVQSTMPISGMMPTNGNEWANRVTDTVVSASSTVAMMGGKVLKPPAAVAMSLINGIPKILPTPGDPRFQKLHHFTYGTPEDAIRFQRDREVRGMYAESNEEDKEEDKKTKEPSVLSTIVSFKESDVRRGLTRIIQVRKKIYNEWFERMPAMEELLFSNEHAQNMLHVMFMQKHNLTLEFFQDEFNCHERKGAKNVFISNDKICSYPIPCVLRPCYNIPESQNKAHRSHCNNNPIQFLEIKAFYA